MFDLGSISQSLSSVGSALVNPDPWALAFLYITAAWTSIKTSMKLLKVAGHAFEMISQAKKGITSMVGKVWNVTLGAIYEETATMLRRASDRLKESVTKRKAKK